MKKNKMLYIYTFLLLSDKTGKTRLGPGEAKRRDVGVQNKKLYTGSLGKVEIGHGNL